MLSAIMTECCVSRPVRAVRRGAKASSFPLAPASFAGAPNGSDDAPAAVSGQAGGASGSSTVGPRVRLADEGLKAYEGSGNYRMRFYIFNMANSSKFADFHCIQAGSHSKFSEIFTDAFSDGQPPDIVFCALPETRLLVSDCLDGIGVLEDDAAGIDQFLFQDAHAEGVLKNSAVRSLIDGLAATYNGNLAAVIGFAGSRFYEEENGSIFGRLAETTVGGAAFPNPKKSFIGRSIRERAGPRFCFVGAHFPLREIKTAVAGATSIEAAKRAIARSLRKVLRRAIVKHVVDANTVIFVMGDLNSRTLIQQTEVLDLLMELLNDDGAQAAIQEGLDIPAGQWHEVASYPAVGDLPVTYKFSTDIGSHYAQSGAAEGQTDQSQATTGEGKAVTLRDVIDAAVAAGFTGSKPGSDEAYLKVEQVEQAETEASKELTEEQVEENTRHEQSEAGVESKDTAVPTGSTTEDSADKDSYLEALRAIGHEKMEAWGLPFSETEWRPFRFPAAADRIVYWAPSGLGERLSWSLSESGYQVCHKQGDSDHRPVYLEGTMHIAEESKETRAKADAWMRRSVESLAQCPALRKFLQQEAEDSDNGGDSTGTS